MFEIRRFFNPPVLADKSLSVSGMGVREWMRGRPVDRPSRGDHLFVFVHDLVENAEGGQWIIFPPGAHQLYGCHCPQWSHSWLHLRGSEVERTINRAALPLNTWIACPDTAELFDAFLRELYAECLESPPMPEVILGLVSVYLMRMARRLGLHGPRPSSGARRAKLLLEAEPCRAWTLDELAADVGLSPSHLSAEFKKYFQDSPIHYLNELRMSQAASLLRTRHWRVGDVAEQTGYADIYHFSKAFKRHYGVSPRDFIGRA